MTPQQELNQLCGEVWNQVSAEIDYNREDPMSAMRGLFNGLLFTLCAGFLFWAGALVLRCFQS